MSSAGCRNDEAPTATGIRASTVRDSADIQIVEDRGEDRPLSWHFTETVRIGSAGDGPEAFYQIDHRSVAVGGTGVIYVLDKGNKRVLAFDDQGRHRVTIGQPGDGPGEFRYPVSLWLRPSESGEEVHVLDFARSRVVRFDQGGPLMDEVEVAALGTTEDVLWTEWGWVYGGWEGYRSQAADSVVDFVEMVRGGDTTRLASVSGPSPQRVFFEKCRFRIALPPLYRQELVWDAIGDTVVIAGEKGYVLSRFNGGRRTRIVRRAIPPLVVTKEQAVDAAELVWNERGSRCVVDGETVLASRGYEGEQQVVARIALSPLGETWVRRNLTGEEGGLGPIDVLDPGGAYLGTLPGGSPFPVAFTPAGDLVVIERDELDVPYVVGYAVTRS